MCYLLYNKNTSLTAKSLAQALGLPAKKVIMSYPPTIRWGNSLNPFEEDTDYNNPHFIDVTAHKIKTFRVLSEHHISSIVYKTGIPEVFPVLIRTILTGSKGKGIIIVNNEGEYKPEYSNFYYSPLIPFSNEYRIHVLGGNIVKVMEKVPLEEGECIIKNSLNCTFKRKDINLMKYGKVIKEIIEQLCGVFPMQIMGVDLGIYEGIPYIIEINSAPSLNSATLELYVNFLKERLCL